jgi:hypothetical protein
MEFHSENRRSFKTRVRDIDGQLLNRTTYKANLTILVCYFNNKRRAHRIGWPAKFNLDSIEYCVNGKRHRLNGPAVIKSNGIVGYYVNGTQYTEEEYPKAVLNYNLKQMLG